MKIGMMAKIEDVGQLVKIVNVKQTEVECELFGERFWLPKRLVKVVR